MSTELNTARICLPLDCQSLFAILQTLDTPVYLNAFYAGLLTLPAAIQKHPPRFIFACNGVSHETLIAQGFTKSVRADETYTRIHRGKIITLHRITPRQHWLYQHSIRTQFYTCTSVFVDNTGQCHDATQEHGQGYLGLMDAHEGVLRTLQDPIHLLEHRPLSVLNTLDRLMRGYTACSTLDIALSHWQAADTNDYELAKESLYHRANQWHHRHRLSDYIKLLQRYHLTEKLLDLPNVDDTKTVEQHFMHHYLSENIKPFSGVYAR